MIADQTSQDCIRSCIEEKKKDNEINGVTVWNKKDDDKVKTCFCERNMARVMKGRTDWKTCFLEPKESGIDQLSVK